MPENPYAAPQSDVLPPPSQVSDEHAYDRLGGWLILVGIGVVVRPIMFGFATLSASAPPFMNGTWQTLTTPGNPAYHPLWSVMLIYELLMNALLGAWSLYVAYLFFGKRKRLPRVIIGFFAANLALLAIDLLLGSQIPIVRQQMGESLITGVLQQVIVCGIWIPYFCVSRRVKGTFVR